MNEALNSIGLENDVGLLKDHATFLKMHGAAVVFIAFDENGQAVTESENTLTRMLS